MESHNINTRNNQNSNKKIKSEKILREEACESLHSLWKSGLCCADGFNHCIT